MEQSHFKNEKAFITKLFIEEIGRLQEEGFHFFSFILMGQAIEVLGAFLDKKPMKATNQAAKRFSKGLNLLMGHQYRLVNENHWLFDKLRSQLTHSFVPSPYLMLTTKETKPQGAQHLQWIDGKLVLIAENMYLDLVKGCLKLFSLMDKGEIPVTRVGELPDIPGLKY